MVNNQQFVGVIENHNIAFRHIAANSTYTKVVSADDWLYPGCIEAMVRLAERNPSVGIVQSYVTNVNGIRWNGCPKASVSSMGEKPPVSICWASWRLPLHPGYCTGRNW